MTRGPHTDRPVYQPSDDSDLLVEAAKQVIDPDDLVVDTGTGSGIVADRLIRSTGATVIASDINPHAIQAARDRGLEVIRGSLVSFLADETVDVAVFNPPYLPADDRLPDDWLDRATTGGDDGFELVSDWIEELPRVLTPDGIGVCIVSSLTDIEHVRTVAETAGFEVSELAERSFPFERLVALELRR